MKSGLFSCLSAGAIPPEQRGSMINTEKKSNANNSKTKSKPKQRQKQKHKSHSKSPLSSPSVSEQQRINNENDIEKENKNDENIINYNNKSIRGVPPTPRNSIITNNSSSLLSPSSIQSAADDIDISTDHCFVFRSRPIDSCKYEPFKVLLLIASAQGFNHCGNQHLNDIDPRLSDQGVKQCKIVSIALRKAKQIRPDIMYCSTMRRALSTMELVCNDWYENGDTKVFATDLLRPRYGKYNSTQRSNINSLRKPFKNCKFVDIKHDHDKKWKKNKLETDQHLMERIGKFLTKYLVSNDELLQTQYGTLKISNTKQEAAFKSSTKRKYEFNKRVAIIAHREIFEFLLKNVIKDVSPQLIREWKHCDLRKIFVYTKQQLGMAPLPYYKLSNNELFSPNFMSTSNSPSLRLTSEYINRLNKDKKLNRNKKELKRSRTPNGVHTKSQSLRGIDTLFNFNVTNERNKDKITTTRQGSIIMTSNQLFNHHSFTLTSCAKLLNQQRIKTNPKQPNLKQLKQPSMRLTKSAEFASRPSQKNVFSKIEIKNDDDEDDEELIDDSSVSEIIDSDSDDDDNEVILPTQFSPNMFTNNSEQTITMNISKKIKINGLSKSQSAMVTKKRKKELLQRTPSANNSKKHIIIVTPPHFYQKYSEEKKKNHIHHENDSNE